jgi:hypothetical protein
MIDDEEETAIATRDWTENSNRARGSSWYIVSDEVRTTGGKRGKDCLHLIEQKTIQAS